MLNEGLGSINKGRTISMSLFQNMKQTTILYGWSGWQMDEWMDEWTDGWTDGDDRGIDKWNVKKHSQCKSAKNTSPFYSFKVNQGLHYFKPFYDKHTYCIFPSIFYICKHISRTSAKHIILYKTASTVFAILNILLYFSNLIFTLYLDS